MPHIPQNFDPFQAIKPVQPQPSRTEEGRKRSPNGKLSLRAPKLSISGWQYSPQKVLEEFFQQKGNNGVYC